MTNHQATRAIINTPPDIFIEISNKSRGTFDFYLAEELVETLRYAVQQGSEALND